MPTGSCLCGATAFTIDSDLADATLCHCSQRRHQTSHVYVSTHIPRSGLHPDDDTHLRRYAASATARRGFCANCGSVLFRDPAGEDRIPVSMGALHEPHSGKLGQHIFTADKGGYYDIEASLTQKP
jgi:hypothetical protein